MLSLALSAVSDQAENDEETECGEDGDEDGYKDDVDHDDDDDDDNDDGTDTVTDSTCNPSLKNSEGFKRQDEEDPLELEEKVKRLRDIFTCIPAVLIKRVLKREDVDGNLDRASTHLMEFQSETVAGGLFLMRTEKKVEEAVSKARSVQPNSCSGDGRVPNKDQSRNTEKAKKKSPGEYQENTEDVSAGDLSVKGHKSGTEEAPGACGTEFQQEHQKKDVRGGGAYRARGNIRGGARGRGGTHPDKPAAEQKSCQDTTGKKKRNRKKPRQYRIQRQDGGAPGRGWSNRGNFNQRGGMVQNWQHGQGGRQHHPGMGWVDRGGGPYRGGNDWRHFQGQPFHNDQWNQGERWAPAQMGPGYEGGWGYQEEPYGSKRRPYSGDFMGGYSQRGRGEANRHHNNMGRGYRGRGFPGDGRGDPGFHRAPSLDNLGSFEPYQTNEGHRLSSESLSSLENRSVSRRGDSRAGDEQFDGPREAWGEPPDKMAANRGRHRGKSRGRENDRGRGRGKVTPADSCVESGAHVSGRPAASSEFEPSKLLVRGLCHKTTTDGLLHFIEAMTKDEVQETVMLEGGKALVTLKELTGKSHFF